MRATLKETVLFEPVKHWLEERDFVVYSEVQLDRRADVVGRCGKFIAVVELKRSLSLDLIEQCVDWRRFAHYVYAAVPAPKRHVNGYARDLLRREGIGLLTIEPARPVPFVPQNQQPQFWVSCELTPRLNRQAYTDFLLRHLHEEHRTGPPGGHRGGGYVTPYRLTMGRIRDVLQSERERRNSDGWLSVRQICERVETHYANPRASVARALLDFEHDWCESKREGDKLYFRLRERSV
ncbi:hypothetical protein [Alicyclobacillus macrosporangiidus]|uniref:hypothetical protein n=1 Tax=Alicyclobacillus macrosporangiidus TaxID=392015 RepID=UPI000494E3C3|nr:hypothetical protein [Alicyclobacillus macrosporangiidus]